MKASVARLSQETNAHNPLHTRLEDFQITVGQAIVDEQKGAGSIIGGMIDRLAAVGAEISPIVSALATSGGRVLDGAFETLADQLVAGVAAADADIVLLDLHGAMMTESLGDAEGALLGRIRSAVGPTKPVLVGLDLHAHVTEAMLRAADILVACKENPHSDLNLTGRRVVDLAIRLARGEISPVTYVSTVPMLLSGASETGSGPLKTAHEHLRRWIADDPQSLDASLCNCQPFLDAPGMGQTVIAVADGHAPGAEAVAVAVGRMLWERRKEFVNRFPTIGAALHRVRAEGQSRPFVISDYGDRTNAGAPGDSPEILRALLLQFPDLKAAVPLTDPALVQAARQVGVGGNIDARVGARFTEGCFDPLRVSGVVEALLPGRFVMKGPMLANQKVEAGPTAIIRAGNCHIVATTRPARTQDVNFYAEQGLPIDRFDCVVVKSGNHFQLSYAGVATPIKAETPGVSLFGPGRFQGHCRSVFPDVAAPKGIIRGEPARIRSYSAPERFSHTS